jgi:hypothetical protein
MNPQSIFIGLAVLGVALLAVAPGWAQPPEWLHTFDDYTFEGMAPFDYIKWLGGAPAFFPAVERPCDTCSPALRLLFTSGYDRAVGLFSDSSQTFDIFSGGVSVKMLIKYSTNPYTFATPGQNTFDVAVAMNVDPQFSSDKTGAHFKGYLVYAADQGANPAGGQPNHRLQVTIQYLSPTGPLTDLCSASGGSVVIEPFDPTTDWWLRGETLDDGSGNVRVRAHIWPDGTSEPNWPEIYPDPATGAVECIDATYLYTSGIVGLGAEQRLAGHPTPYTSYIDVDTVSARLVPEHVCFNNADDDLDSLIDCDDPDCAAAPACACHDPFADADGDGDVDQADFAVFQACLTGEAGGLLVGCDCFDRDDANFDGFFNPPDDGDEDVDNIDLDKFEACASGPGIAADPTCDNLNY